MFVKYIVPFDFVDKFLWLIAATNPEYVAKLEAEAEITQAEAVDYFIEETCWGNDLPDYVGGRGTPAERLKAFRSVLRRSEPHAHMFPKAVS